jgi:type II secretory pathway pseudopilin PulG
MSVTEPSHGFTLIELLVSMITVFTLMLGLVKFYQAQHRTHSQQEQSVAMEENLRLASTMVTDALRNVRYAAPGSPAALVTWVPGLTNANPAITYSSGPNVSSMSLTACFREPVATLTAPAIVGDGSLSAAPTGGGALGDVLDATPNPKSLIHIGENGEFAQITSVGSTSIGIDTALASGAQPLTRAYPAGTKLCRVDVVTFTLGNDPGTNVPRLLRDDNLGDGPQAAAEGVDRLQINLTPPRRYIVTLRARSEKLDPMTGSYLTRSLITNVATRN